MLFRPRRLRTAAAFLFLALLPAAGHAQGWNWGNPPSGGLIADLFFTDPQNGTIVLTNGNFFHTSDGGASWQLRWNLPGVSRLFFTSPDTGFLVGASGMIGRTFDGGASWDTALYPPYASLYGVSFTDSRHGVAVGFNGTILRTTDGGDSWSRIPTGTTGQFADVAFADAQVGVAVGNKVIFRTTNGGVSWSGKPSYDVRSVAFLDASTAVAVGPSYALEKTPQTFLKSIDRGQSWVPVSPSNGGDSLYSLLSVRSPAPGVAFAAGLNLNGSPHALVLKTIDDGASWFEQDVPSDVPLSIIAAPSASTAYVGGGTVLYRSTDGGGNYRVRLLSPTNGYAFHQEGMPLLWRALPGAPRYRLVVGTSPDFPFDSTIADVTTSDTAAIISGVAGLTSCYWKMQTTSDTSDGPWSFARNFGALSFPELTVRALQLVPPESLAVADSLQNAARQSLQSSAWFDKPGVNIHAVCVVAPGTLIDRTDGSPLAVVWGGTPGDSLWGGIIVNASHAPSATEFSRIRRGDRLYLSGFVVEDIYPEEGTMTRLIMNEFRNDGPGGTLPAPARASIAMFHTGSYAGGRTVYSTGERYEGLITELHDVSVQSALNASDGTIILRDELGNMLATSDISSWFTLSGRKDPSSAYAMPPPGAVIDTIRGLVVTEPGAGGAPVYKLAPVMPGDIVLGVQHRGMIRGRVVDDVNRDSTALASEPGISGWKISVAGKADAVVPTADDGSFQIRGLDSGTYVLTQEVRAAWTPTYPPGVTHTVKLGPDDTTAPILFANFFPWNRISGTVYRDENENGRRDSSEPGLAGFLIRYSGNTSDSATTDSLGHYRFVRIDAGITTIQAVPGGNWEESQPRFGGGYRFDIQSYGQAYDSLDFGLHPAASRIRITLHVHDNTVINGRDIWWGLRRGASYGIWGVDPSATNIDYSEGEFEVPPPTLGLFDARLVDPHGSIARFGYGSWTDMRDFVSPGQTDTFFVTFAPGYFFGGDYPMTISWDRARLGTLFAGPVSLAFSGTDQVDMRLVDSLVIADTSVGSVTIAATGPIMPTVGVRPRDTRPATFHLAQNYPNPFNPSTTILYGVAGRGEVRLEVFDILGRSVALLADGVEEPGEHVVTWHAASIPSGVYFCRLQAGGAVAVRKLLLLR